MAISGIGLVGRSPADFFNVILRPNETIPGLDFVGGRNPANNQPLVPALGQVLEQVTLLQSRGVNKILLVDHAQDFTGDPLSTKDMHGIDVIITAGSTGFIARPEATGPFNRLRPGDKALGEYPVYDLGGGLGARYTWADEPPSVPEYLDGLIGAAREHLPAGAEIIIEPGRSMVATMATTIYRVTTVKRGRTTFVGVDGGMGDNLEVALYDQRFEAAVAGRMDDDTGLETVTVVGRHCESGDVLIDPVPLPAPRVGDLLAVPSTGAYCYTMSNNYNGNRRIPVVFACEGHARLVVRRETWDDLMSRDV